ncbi:hypothetical protein [Bradyrhizobium shewense]|nr:hypothetical protein [Bradyrhizobium shewense]
MRVLLDLRNPVEKLESLHGMHGLYPPMAAKTSVRKFDPSDAIAVITGYRRQQFPLERELAFLGFVAWMLFPMKAQLVQTAQIIGAANYFIHLPKARRASLVRANPYFSQELFAKTLLTFPLGDTFSMEFESAFNELANINELIEFFMICPIEKRPSLLKALHFIEKGGFVPADVNESDRNAYKRSRSTLKVSWVNYAIAGPFIWSAMQTNYEFITRLSPDLKTTIDRVEKFLAKKHEVMEFFELARFCQVRLIPRLDERSRSRFRFLEFPPNVTLVDVELSELDSAQTTILKDYRPPKLIDKD